VIFTSTREGNSEHLYQATRPARGEPFGPPTKLPGLPGEHDESPTLSRDGTTLVFVSSAPDRGDRDLFLAERTCLVTAQD
jgi:WD40 repeat protein